MFSLGDLFVFALLIGFCALWWNSQGVKQIALQATRNYCKKMEVQLLDDGVALRGFWLKRDRQGQFRLWRSYEFEFTSTGEERYRGLIVLLGLRVESINLDPHRLN